MAASLEQVLARIQHWTSPRLGELGDAALLERFVHGRDESAFAALVTRHGDMVLRSCRRVLGDEHQAEDAFQATFLILARKAATLKQPDALAGWLHGVARRVALKARCRDKKPACRATGGPPVATFLPDPLAQLTARELLTVLDEEVARLPLAQGSAVLLCCLEGRTQEEAARLLGWTAGSLKGHLERGRRRLQQRLTRRGITLSAALAIVVVSRGEAASALLLRSTIAAALGGAGNSAAALAHSVVKAMFLAKLAGMTALVLSFALAASATVALVFRGPFAPTPEDKIPAVPNAAKNAETSKPPVRTDVLGDPLPPRAVARLGSLRLNHGHQFGVRRITLSPDGRWVVSSSIDGNRLWDAATGRELPLRSELRRSAFFATRDKLLAVEITNLGLQLWDVATGKKVGRLVPAGKLGLLPDVIRSEISDGYSSLALAPDGGTLVVSNLGDAGAGVQQVLRFYDVVRGKVEKPAALERSDKHLPSRMAFSADSKALVVQCADATIHVWDVAGRTEKVVSRSRANDYGGPIALAPDGKILATAFPAGKRVRLWDTRTLKELPPLLQQPHEPIRTVVFSPDGKQLVSLNADSPTLRLWDLATRKKVRQFQGKNVRLFHAAFSADGKYLAAGDGEDVTFWILATGQFRHDFGHTWMVDSLQFSRDGQKLVSAAGWTNGVIRIWNPLTGEQTGQLRGHSAGVEVITYSPDGKLLASGSVDGSVRLWDAASGRELRRLEAKDGYVYALAFAPDGKTIASGGKRKAVHLWDAATGRELRSFPNPGQFILRLAFSPDGKLLATWGQGEREIRLWDVAKGEQIHRLTVSRAACPDLRFSPDGQTLAAGSDDGSVRLWDVPSAEERGRIAVPLKPGETDPVDSVAFSADGRNLAVGYADRSVRLWELASGRERLRFEGHQLIHGHLGGIMSLAFSPDGTLLASGGIDHIIMVWDVTGQRTTHFPRKDRLGAEECNTLWSKLADSDARKAYRTMQTLLAAGEQAVLLFKDHLHPATVIDRRRIDRLIADLDSDSFELREKAAQELRGIGSDAEPALRKALTSKLSVEQRLRIKQLLQEIGAARSPEYLRGLRAVEVLEWLGTTEAQRVLKTLAGGDPSSRLTREAKAALHRLTNGRR